jgi:hypothetical protein
MLGPEEMWAHMVLTDMTKDQYKQHRMLQIKQKAVHYPDYNIVREAKPKWMPPAEDIHFSDDGFESIVPMQSSLNHNLKQILDENLINRLKTIKTIQPNVRFRLFVKAGADGSSGHISYQNMGELFLFLGSLYLQAACKVSDCVLLFQV